MIIFSGLFVGFCFDFYRIVRWRIGLNKVLTFIGDLFFSFIALLLIYFFAQKANFLELRFYLFGGCLLGLLIYLRFFSPASKKLFNTVINIIVNFIKLVIHIIATIFRTFFQSITLLMRIPYGLLRWLALLLFRIGEALGMDSVMKIKGRITKSPRQ